MARIFRNGVELKGDERKAALERQHAIRARHSGAGKAPTPVRGAGGGKGGNRPAQIDPTSKSGKELIAKFNNDGRYGYYNTKKDHEKYKYGEYVPFLKDATDGGGFDTSGTFFKGAGPISNLLNVAEIRPYGQSQTPREQIGYRDFTDMTDRGGPQASGGAYEGGGLISAAANLVDQLSGVDQGTRTPYNTPTQVTLNRPRVRPATLMTNRPDELMQEPFNNTIPGPDELGGVPFNNQPRGSDMPNMNMPANAAYLDPLEPFGGRGRDVTQQTFLDNQPQDAEAMQTRYVSPIVNRLTEVFDNNVEPQEPEFEALNPDLVGLEGFTVAPEDVQFANGVYELMPDFIEMSNERRNRLIEIFKESRTQ